jgi:hypothetical protein
MQGSNSEYYSQENSHPMIYKLVIVLIYQNTLERMLLMINLKHFRKNASHDKPQVGAVVVMIV